MSSTDEKASWHHCLLKLHAAYCHHVGNQVSVYEVGGHRRADHGMQARFYRGEIFRHTIVRSVLSIAPLIVCAQPVQLCLSLASIQLHQHYLSNNPFVSIFFSVISNETFIKHQMYE